MDRFTEAVKDEVTGPFYEFEAWCQREYGSISAWAFASFLTVLAVIVASLVIAALVSL